MGGDKHSSNRVLFVVEKFFQKPLDFLVTQLYNLCVTEKRGDKVVAKVGRPKSENPRKNNTRIRMTDEEVAMLEYCAEHTGKTKTEILMLGLDKVYNEIKK
ncbi:hypothetical protein HO957_06290 [Streptococcus suis]|nr:hypothetical protein [Streptococcus suis]